MNNITYNQFGFNLAQCKELKLNAEDLMILRWFLDFYPSMKKKVINDCEYSWVNYRYLLNNLQIIYCKEESLAKRFTKYCELGLLEKEVVITKIGKMAFFRAREQIILLYSHTDKNRDAHTDKNRDAHTDKNRDNSSTIYSSTNNSEKIYKKEISISKKEDLEQIKENHFKEIYGTFCEKEDLQERTIKSKEYQDTFKKYQNALKKYSHEEILRGIQDYIIFLQCQRKTGFNRDKQGIIPFFNQEKFLGEKGSSWQELIDKMSKDIQDEVMNKLKFTRLKQEMQNNIEQKAWHSKLESIVDEI